MHDHDRGGDCRQRQEGEEDLFWARSVLRHSVGAAARTPQAEIAAYFDGLDLVPPGLTDVWA